MEVLVEYLAKGFMAMLSISMPCVLIAAGVGLVIGILQAVTQVQEQTIATAPKICLVFLAIIVLGGYFLKIMMNYFYEGINLAFEIVPRKETYVIPSDYYKYTKPFDKEMQDKINENKKLNKAYSNKGNIQWDKKAIKQQVYIKSNQVNAVSPNFLEKVQMSK